jgi:ferritin-like metal-binding protein YciE
VFHPRVHLHEGNKQSSLLVLQYSRIRRPRKKGETNMGLFTRTEFNSLDDLFVDQLDDLYSAEQQLTDALPKMAEAARSPQLKEAFQNHLRETESQIARLEQIFQRLGKEPGDHTCEAMKGLIKEGKEVIDAKGDANVRDAGLIAAAQRVEHYEIAGYGTTRTFAQRLGYPEVARLLQQTLDEEGNADKMLTQIAEQSINWKASSVSA